MGRHLTLRYDREGDILYLDRCAPYSEQESVELGDDVVARLHPRTDEIENLEILYFSTRLSQGEAIDLPIAVDFIRS
jgi:hypothetical protein